MFGQLQDPNAKFKNSGLQSGHKNKTSKWGTEIYTMKTVFTNVFIIAFGDDHIEVGPCPHHSGFLRFFKDLRWLAMLGLVRPSVASGVWASLSIHGLLVKLGHGFCAGSDLTPGLSLGVTIGKGFRNLWFFQTMFLVPVCSSGSFLALQVVA